MKNLVIAISLMATTVFGANFKPVKRLGSAAVENLSKVVDQVTQNESIFGDSSFGEGFSFTAKEGEEVLNTIKQLNRKRGDLNSDDKSAIDFEGKSAEQLVEHLLYAFSNSVDSDQEKAFNEAKAKLTNALRRVLSNKTLKIFGTNHADEDGSWQIIDVLDTQRSQILFIRFGYFGT